MTREPSSPLDGDPVTGMWPTGLGCRPWLWIPASCRNDEGASMMREPSSPLDGEPVTGMWPTGLGVPSVALDSGVLPE